MKTHEWWLKDCSSEEGEGAGAKMSIVRNSPCHSMHSFSLVGGLIITFYTILIIVAISTVAFIHSRIFIEDVSEIPLVNHRSVSKDFRPSQHPNNQECHQKYKIQTYEHTKSLLQAIWCYFVKLVTVNTSNRQNLIVDPPFIHMGAPWISKK